MSDSIGKRTARGVAMLTAGSLVIKVLGVITQLLLAAMLLPGDFQLIALALSIGAMSELVQCIGVREILIREHDRYGELANPGFWIALLSGVGAAVIMAVAAHPAASLFEEPRLVPLILVLAAASPFQNLALVVEARIEGQLRFGLVNSTNLAVAGGQCSLLLAFAAMGLGPMSFVLPRLVVHASKLAVLWSIVRPPVRWSPEFHAAGPFVRGGVPIFGAFACHRLMTHGDYLLLGLVSKATVGFYFFAFNQSTQVWQLVIQNFLRALLPGLSALKSEPEHQVRAFLRGAGALAILSAPLGVMHAAMADPFLKLLYGDKWVQAIAPLQVLALGSVLSMVVGPAMTLMLAQGRYWVRFWSTFASAVAFLACVGGGAWLGDAVWGRAGVGAAVGVGVARFASAVGVLIAGAAPARVPLAGLMWPVFYPAAGAALAIGPVWAATLLIPAFAETTRDPVKQLLQMTIVAVFGPLVYLVWIRVAAWRSFVELVRLVASALGPRGRLLLVLTGKIGPLDDTRADGQGDAASTSSQETAAGSGGNPSASRAPAVQDAAKLDGS